MKLIACKSPAQKQKDKTYRVNSFTEIVKRSPMGCNSYNCSGILPKPELKPISIIWSKSLINKVGNELWLIFFRIAMTRIHLKSSGIVAKTRYRTIYKANSIGKIASIVRWSSLNNNLG